ncbi:low temperature requirement protein A [Streptomyces sp. 135]|uniref:low temperature requirement protein A n=1 Tax=Streptomyces sp. 135 TaxID=2838850 RepID=UPI001CBC0F76|nr:low temperature requirement protein A [Streptomyces sp. 135]
MSTSMSGSSGSGSESEGGERHASWLELFFDLIVVAGVGQLAHLLHTGPSWTSLGQYAVLFLAFWFAWVMPTMYGNVAGEGTRVVTVVAAMFGMAVMAAAVPGVHDSDGKARAFALGYIVVRLIASRVWSGRRQVVADLPIIQLGAGLTPWVVSLWAHGEARLWLWAAGLLIDIAVMVRVSREALQAEVDQKWAHAEERAEHWLRREERRSVALPPEEAHARVDRVRSRLRRKPQVVAADTEHLSERLGLFVLIVLGEGLVQSASAASEEPWGGAMRAVGIGVFVVLVLVWSLALRTGAYGLPLLAPRALPVRLVLLLHCLFAGAVAALSAALGRAVEQAGDAMPQPGRLLLAGVLALSLAMTLVCALVSGWGVGWALGAVGPALVVVGVLAAAPGTWVPEGFGTVVSVALAVLALAWPVAWRAYQPGTTATKEPARGAGSAGFSG